MLFSANIKGWGTLTGHHSEGEEALSSEPRCWQLSDEPFEQIRCVIVVNLIPAIKASVEISLQLLFQPLKKKESLMRSWPKDLPHTPSLGLNFLICKVGTIIAPTLVR